MTLEVWKTSIRQKNENKFQPRTVDKIAKLMMIYEDKYPFNRQIVANRFEISENAASRILKRAIDCGIVRKEKKAFTIFNFHKKLNPHIGDDILMKLAKNLRRRSVLWGVL